MKNYYVFTNYTVVLVLILLTTCFESFSQNFDEVILRLKKETPGEISDFDIVDFNGNGLKDVVFLSGSSGFNNPKISYYENLGNNNFKYKLIIEKDSNSNLNFDNEGFIRVADLNNNGLKDIITSGVNGFSVFKNQGDGSYIEQTIGTSQASYIFGDIKLVDLNNNGLLDILIRRTSNSSTIVSTLYYINDGNWNFFSNSINYALDSIDVVDYNNNGLPDILGIFNGNIMLFENNNNDTFNASYLIQSFNLDFCFNSIRTEDLNNDGMADILLYP